MSLESNISKYNNSMITLTMTVLCADLEIIRFFILDAIDAQMSIDISVELLSLKYIARIYFPFSFRRCNFFCYNHFLDEKGRWERHLDFFHDIRALGG